MYSTVAHFLRLTPAGDGQVPDHGWTTLVSTPVAGEGRIVTSLLYHDPEHIEIRQSAVDTEGIHILFSRICKPEEVVLHLFGLVVVSNGLVAYDECFTGADVRDHVRWLQSKGIELPANHAHWHSNCLTGKKEPPKDPIARLLEDLFPGAIVVTSDDLPSLLDTLANKTGSPTPRPAARPTPPPAPSASGDWSAVKQVIDDATKHPAPKKQEFLPIDAAAGERPYISLVQDRPHQGRVLKFLSKETPTGTIKGVFIGIDTNTGTESLVSEITVEKGQLDGVLADVASRAFTNGARWTICES